MDYRRNITKSKSGHYHLTLICKTTGLKVTGDYGWSTPQQARNEEEPKLVVALESRRAIRRAVSSDMHRVAVAVAAAEVL